MEYIVTELKLKFFKHFRRVVRPNISMPYEDRGPSTIEMSWNRACSEENRFISYFILICFKT